MESHWEGRFDDYRGFENKRFKHLEKGKTFIAMTTLSETWGPAAS